MASLGKNLKITAPLTVLAEVRGVFTEVFGAKIARTCSDMEVYELGDGTCVGFAFVEPSAALSGEDTKRGAWIEILVDDPTQTRRALAARGIVPFDYTDKEREYYQLSGGQVARLAASR